MTMAGDPYSAAVRRHFHAPRHAGCLDDGQLADHNGQGVRVRLSMRQDGGTILGLRFQAYGCPHLIAAAEAFCSTYEGRPVTELATFAAVDLIRELPVPIEKTGRILVLEDAVRALVP